MDGVHLVLKKTLLFSFKKLKKYYYCKTWILGTLRFPSLLNVSVVYILFNFVGHIYLKFENLDTL